jgi:hypothetical protein
MGTLLSKKTFEIEYLSSSSAWDHPSSVQHLEKRLKLLSSSRL